jgi:PKD repeat protein
VAPLPVQFTGAATDPDAGDTVSYSWDFGDGSAASTQQNPTHTYTTPGEKTAKLTVSDGKGGTATKNVTVNVLEPDDAEARFRVLVFSKTAGFRHSSIAPGHTAIEQLGADNDFQVDHTEDSTAFRDDILGHYDSVIWLSTTGDVLNDTQQAAFERYIKAGHGYTGIHAAADTEYEWKWYGRLVGAYFLSHPPGLNPGGGRNGDVLIEDTTDYSTQGLPAPRWPRDDEWYNYKPVNFEQTGNVDYSPRAGGVHVLAKLDESTYEEQDGSDGVDDDHPISWCQRYEGGRSWYTGMGHTDASFTEPAFLNHIRRGIEVSAGAAASAECGEVEEGVPVVQGFADPPTGTAPLQVQFSATAADPDDQALIYRWTFGDGGSALGPDPVHTYGTPGVYTATVTVRDPDGHTATDTVEVTVNAAGNQVPLVVTAADPVSGNAPLPVHFQADAIDPDGDETKLVYRWDFGDGGAQFGADVRHTYMTPGTYKAKVKVTDAKGGSTTSEEITITVNNPPGNAAPTVEALADPASGTAPLTVRFSSASSDPDGDQLLSVWDFGDGIKAGGAAATHTYTAPGTYNAKVTVTDPGGKSATATVQVIVRPKTTTGGTGQPPGRTGDGGVKGDSDSRPGVRLTKRHKVRVVLKRGLRYTVTCETKCRVSSVLKVQGQRLGKSNARLIAAGHSRKIVLRLDRQVRSNLVAAMRKANVRSLRATLVMKIRTSAGTKTIRKAVVLRR